MNKKILIPSILLFIVSFNFSEVKSQINNKIIVKVGSLIISSYDVQNEILTNLMLKKKEFIQENIDIEKKFAIKNLINKSIKKIEIEKLGIKNYNKKDLFKYEDKIAKIFNTNKQGLEKIFKRQNLNYDSFVKKHETELLWNSLIFTIYQNQLNINVIDVDNEFKKIIDNKKIEYNLSEIEISNSLNNKKEINEILELIKSEGFESTARRKSIANSSKKGGLIGWILNLSLSEKYLKQIEKLDEGDISAPIQNDNSFSILKLNSIRKNDSDTKEKDLKKRILERKKEEKLKLFSRSHFSNLENTVEINFL
jgi:parvulin-like peptidyl-prolyl isomerase